MGLAVNDYDNAAALKRAKAIPAYSNPALSSDENHKRDCLVAYRLRKQTRGEFRIWLETLKDRDYREDMRTRANHQWQNRKTQEAA